MSALSEQVGCVTVVYYKNNSMVHKMGREVYLRDFLPDKNQMRITDLSGQRRTFFIDLKFVLDILKVHEENSRGPFICLL